MIEALNRDNLEEFLPLIRKYQEFYNVAAIDDGKNRQFFQQFDRNSEKGCLFGYRRDENLVAFATVYFSYASSIANKVGIMNDLFTLEPYRRQGIASALIKYCQHYAKQQNAARLQWLSAVDNHSAHALYNSLGAKQSSWDFFYI